MSDSRFHGSIALVVAAPIVWRTDATPRTRGKRMRNFRMETYGMIQYGQPSGVQCQPRWWWATSHNMTEDWIADDISHMRCLILSSSLSVLAAAVIVVERKTYHHQ